MDYTVSSREMACLDMDTRALRPGCPVGGMPCPVASCSTGHLNFRQLVRHWKRYHELEIHAHKCPLCGITDTRRNDLKRHIRVMHWVTGGNMENLMKNNRNLILQSANRKRTQEEKKMVMNNQHRIYPTKDKNRLKTDKKTKEQTSSEEREGGDHYCRITIT
ncbi:unnamed protein product [Mytilus edulis]|uniref:C2H2-type domain-containing protein n=1 Tax=Mytilus edulis TaxID=6550 RepID=A0A8S3QVU0_MYTED|nr:unnamed protein product [Mytilus edulis]